MADGFDASARPELFCMGLSHKSAPIEVREKLAVPDGQARALLQSFAARPGVVEAVLLSTCNRVELFAAVNGPDAAEGLAATFLERGGDAVRPHLHRHHGESAVVHLFRVASSLDSMVVGEPQILGQLKDAFADSVDAGTVGGELTRACEAAFAAAKRVRTETGIGAAAVSMASAAVELAQKIFGKLAGRPVLVVGTGSMGELCARHLLAERAELHIASRTHARAEALAQALGAGARARRFDELAQLLIEADVVVTCTAAPSPIFTTQSVTAALHARRGRPLFLVDLAVPRDVDPAVHGISNVFAYNVDDLEQVVAQNLASRSSEAARAEVLVAEEVARFIRAKTARDAVPILGQLRRHADAIAATEVEKTLAVLGDGLTSKQRQSVEAMSRAIVNKLLHAPTARLRSAGETGPEEAARVAAAAAELFGFTERVQAPAERDGPEPARPSGDPAPLPLHGIEASK